MGLTTRLTFPVLFVALLLSACSSFNQKPKAPIKRDPGFKFGVLRTGLDANQKQTAEIWLTDKPINCNTSGSFQRIGSVLNAPNAGSVRAGIKLRNRTGASANVCANWQCKQAGAIEIQVTREHNNHLQGTWELSKTGQKGPFNIKKCT